MCMEDIKIANTTKHTSGSVTLLTTGPVQIVRADPNRKSLLLSCDRLYTPTPGAELPVYALILYRGSSSLNVLTMLTMHSPSVLLRFEDLGECLTADILGMLGEASTGDSLFYTDVSYNFDKSGLVK